MPTSIVSLKVVQEIKDFAYGITRTCQKLSRKIRKDQQTANVFMALATVVTLCGAMKYISPCVISLI